MGCRLWSCDEVDSGFTCCQKFKPCGLERNGKTICACMCFLSSTKGTSGSLDQWCTDDNRSSAIHRPRDVAHVHYKAKNVSTDLKNQNQGMLPQNFMANLDLREPLFKISRMRRRRSRIN